MTPVADAYVSSAAPGTNYGRVPILYVGVNENSVGRSLFRFDLSSLGPGTRVVSAAFETYLAASSTTPRDLAVELRHVDSSWTEFGVTWKDQPRTTSIGKVNGVGTEMKYYSWDVGGLVQGWLDGMANNGLALWSYAEAAFGWRGFASREGPSPPTPPRLAITYWP